MSYSNPIVAGDTLIRDAIKSENYEPGVSGWAIFRDGTAEFNDITARGNITANSLRVVTDEGVISIEDSGTLNEIQLAPDTLGPDDEPAAIRAFDTGGTYRMNIIGALHDGGLQNFPQISLIDDGVSRRLFMSAGRMEISVEEEVEFLGGALTAPHVTNAVMRSQEIALGINTGRTTTSNTFTASSAAGDSISLIVRRPPSNRLKIRVWAQLGVTSGQGIVSFEVRDNNSVGTVRFAAADADSIIMPSAATGNNSYQLDEDVDVAGSSSNLFVRPMWRATSGGATLTIARIRLHVEPDM